MATHHHHASRSSNHSKRPLPAHARPSKPGPLSKRSNSHGASKGGQKVAHHRDEEPEDDESMAASFLNFCTTCEKQIIVPSNSVLYCSESCRKRDNEKSFMFPSDISPTTTIFTNIPFDIGHRDIVPPRSPTHPKSKRSSCAFSDSDDNMLSGDERSHYPDSEASRYLRHFQSSTYSGETTVRPQRPRFNRASTSQVTFSAAPSLSHTPASSVSYSLPYTPSTRPLPPRTNPHASSYSSKSIDLVTPWHNASTAPPSPPQYSLKAAPVSMTSTSTIEGEILYEKSPVPSLSPANGSLGRLLASTPN